MYILSLLFILFNFILYYQMQRNIAQQSAEDKKLYNKMKNGLKKLRNENTDLVSENNKKESQLIELRKMLSDRSTANVYIYCYYLLLFSCFIFIYI